MLFFEQPRIWVCKCILPAHIQPCIHQHSQVLLSRAAHPPAWTDNRDCPDPGAAPSTWPYWILWDSHGPLLEPVQMSLDGIPSFRWSSPSLNLVSLSDKLRVHSVPSSVPLMNIQSSIGLHTDPWGTPLDTDVHLDIELLATTQPSNQFLIHWTVCPSLFNLG